MTPFFSIIIPVYNVAPYLRECLDSVLAQTFTDWEAICVDDGSTDGSGSILDEYAARDSRFRIIHQPNAGVSAARNKGLDVAKGEWVAFLDGDDIWEKSWLNAVADAIEPEIDWIRTGWTDWYINDGKKVECQSKVTGVDGKVYVQKVIAAGWQLISKCAFPSINFYRRALLRDVRFVEGIRFREDALFCYEMAAMSKGLKIISATGYFRRIRLDGATYSYRRRDDTINLLTSYVHLWGRITKNMACAFEKYEIVKSSTFWVHKDIYQWFAFCYKRTIIDELKVWIVAQKLLCSGAISWNIGGSCLDRLRWWLYLCTGCGRVLLINRMNLIGRARKVAIL